MCEKHKEIRKAYKNYCYEVNNQASLPSETELCFGAEVAWRSEDFNNFIENAFDNRNFPSFNSNYKYSIPNIKEEEFDANFMMDIWTALENHNSYGGMNLKVSYTLKSVLNILFDDWFNIHYIVQSGNDKIKDMSPGKKALTLLELLISLKDTHCPILIDQPEDDLDNRSVCNELVKFIKKKKDDRQIIVVTHNANVVLGADAEQVIIANQHGNNTPNNNDLRFEYRSGAIEEIEGEYEIDGNLKNGILSQKGIQSQICDILEGGKTAFEHRRSKYTNSK